MAENTETAAGTDQAGPLSAGWTLVGLGLVSRYVHVGVHEFGHALIGSLLLDQLPAYVYLGLGYGLTRFVHPSAANSAIALSGFAASVGLGWLLLWISPLLPANRVRLFGLCVATSLALEPLETLISGDYGELGHLRVYLLPLSAFMAILLLLRSIDSVLVEWLKGTQRLTKIAVFLVLLVVLPRMIEDIQTAMLVFLGMASVSARLGIELAAGLTVALVATWKARKVDLHLIAGMRGMAWTTFGLVSFMVGGLIYFGPNIILARQQLIAPVEPEDAIMGLPHTANLRLVFYQNKGLAANLEFSAGGNPLDRRLFDQAFEKRSSIAFGQDIVTEFVGILRLEADRGATTWQGRRLKMWFAATDTARVIAIDPASLGTFGIQTVQVFSGHQLLEAIGVSQLQDVVLEVSPRFESVYVRRRLPNAFDRSGHSNSKARPTAAKVPGSGA